MKIKEAHRLVKEGVRECKDSKIRNIYSVIEESIHSAAKQSQLFVQANVYTDTLELLTFLLKLDGFNVTSQDAAPDNSGAAMSFLTVSWELP